MTREPIILSNGRPEAWAFTYEDAAAFVCGYGSYAAALEQAVMVIERALGKRIHRALVRVCPLQWGDEFIGCAIGQEQAGA